MLSNLLDNLPDSLRAAIMTTIFTFVGTVGAATLGLLSEVDGWINDGVQPDWSAFGSVVLSAAVAVAAGIVNWVVREVQARTGRGQPPHYES